MTCKRILRPDNVSKFRAVSNMYVAIRNKTDKDLE